MAASETMQQELFRFNATNERGRTVELVAVQPMQSVPGDDGFMKSVAVGPKEIQTTDGRVVEYCAPGAYMMPDGTKLVSDDPKAP